MSIAEVGGYRIVTFARCPVETGTALVTTRDVGPDPLAPTTPERAFCAAARLAPNDIAWCAQVHGARIVASTRPGMQGEADALVTDRAGVVLSMRTADCVPVFLAAADVPAIALVHAGWRGAAAAIASATVEALVRLYGARPERMWAGLGPAIGPAAYEVGEDVASRFPARRIERSGGRTRLDLPGVVADQLRTAGVADVEESGLCTATRNDLFFSYRTEKTSGRLFSLFALAHSHSATTRW